MLRSKEIVVVDTIVENKAQNIRRKMKMFKRQLQQKLRKRSFTLQQKRRKKNNCAQMAFIFLIEKVID